MIIAEVIGGLGNQMFQYAACRALSLRFKTGLALDISGFENYRLHQGFELRRLFSGAFDIASSADVRRVLGWQSSPSVRRIVLRRPFSLFLTKRLVVEPHFHYWQGINSISRDSYLSGYWQSEKYFADFSSQIRADFAFRQPMDGYNADLAEQMSRLEGVSLHVRRGDYANNPKTMATHGLCSLDYYRAAIRHVVEHVRHPHFFIFSDDIEWVRDNLDVGFPCVYVEHNRGKDSYNDMRLMSLCRHHIIANSSFSWWGAWLNPSTKKIVVAPSKWFATKTHVTDLFPSSWRAL